MTVSDAMGFLGVTASLNGRRWLGPGPEVDRQAEAIVQASGVDLAVARVLARRGVVPHEALAFLAPSLRELLPDPRGLKDMERAADRFVQSLRKGERIAIFADYDVDGAASAALLITWLRDFGLVPTLYVPDRIDEGYGPNDAAMEALGRAHDLIICVDCGTLSHGPIAAAGCDVLVLDHHLAGETLPPAFAVVNPNRQDESGALGHLCAAGVVFLFLVEANRLMRPHGRTGPDLLGALDLVGLATVADVAPLIGVNRALVRQGLAVMARRARPGLVALADVARLASAPTAHSLGFVLGPRVNAGGRIGQADLGARLLSTDDPVEAERLASHLDALNTERRAIEAAVRAEAMAQVEARGAEGPLVWAVGEGWHPGVVGIVAARLKEAFNRPAVVIGLEAGIGKGSARSIPGVDLGAAVQRIAAQGLLLKGGGHRMAAGLTVAEELIVPAMAALARLVARQGAVTGAAHDLALDGLLAPQALRPELVARLESAGPFGASAPAPRFALADQRVSDTRRIGESHLRVTFGSGDARVEAIAFGAFDGPLGPALCSGAAGSWHLAGRLELDDWRGRQRVQLRLEDAAPAQA